MEKDINGLNDLLRDFSQKKQKLEFRIHYLTEDCENYHKALTEVELEQIYLQKQIVSLFIKFITDCFSDHFLKAYIPNKYISRHNQAQLLKNVFKCINENYGSESCLLIIKIRDTQFLA